MASMSGRLHLKSSVLDSIHMSQFTDSEADMKAVSDFTYDRHSVAYFHNPQDDIMPRSLTRFVPWTVSSCHISFIAT